MLRPALFTAQKGKDVFVDNPKFRTIDSTRNQFKVAYSGEETFSLNAGNNYNWSKTVTHNLGYVPLAICYAYYIEMNEAMTTMVKVEKFTLIPYAILRGTTPMTTCLIAVIERTNTQVKFRFFQDDDWKYPYEDPQFYTLSNMKMKYFIFIDRE